MHSPYESLPKEAFWRTGVVGQRADKIEGLYRKKFSIRRSDRIATAGSCFAQHIARHLVRRKFTVIDAEPAPFGLSRKSAAEFGFGLYSARYANIYTARQLWQLVREAFGKFDPADPVWEKDGRFYDAMRPSVEPTGLSSAEAVLDQRVHHLEKVRQIVRSADVFIFTLGLTEAWMHKPSSTIYPTAPGTIAGRYDPAVHKFKNFSFGEVYDDLRRVFKFMKKRNRRIRFLLTVSPVPLTATASGGHVLAATVYSKSVLRAVAGQLCQERDDVEYFPSYEIITSSLSKGAYFESNMRTVRTEGVAAAMQTFFAEHDHKFSAENGSDLLSPALEETAVRERPNAQADVVCEEALLDAFAQ
jgi:hypothetical protein